MEALSVPEAGRRAHGGALRAGRRHRGPGALRSAGDEQLTGLAAAGEEAAFEVLYARYSAAILRYLRRRLRSGEEAEDVHQQVFLSAFSALRTGVEPLHFKAWLYRIAHNVCVSELRAQRPAAGPIDDERGLACVRSDAAPASRQDLRELLDDLALLPRSQSSALLLREVHDLSYTEIAETLHLPVGAVRSNIFRARASLQALSVARDADCSEIRGELERLAGRRGRRSARIANHLRVCASCEDFRRGLRRRPAALSLLPFLPLGWQRQLRALFGSPASEATANEIAVAGMTAGGMAAGVKVAAVAASVVAISVSGGAVLESAVDAPEPEGAVGQGGPPRAVVAGPARPEARGATHAAARHEGAGGRDAAAAPLGGPDQAWQPQHTAHINLPAPRPRTERERENEPVAVTKPAPVAVVPVAPHGPHAPQAGAQAPVAATGAPAAPVAGPGEASEPSGPGPSPDQGTSGPSQPAPDPVTQPSQPADDDGQRRRRNRNRNRGGDSDRIEDDDDDRQLEQRTWTSQPAAAEPLDESRTATEETSVEPQAAAEPEPVAQNVKGDEPAGAGDGSGAAA